MMPLLTHMPAPLQVSCLVSTPFMQDWVSPHAVPAGYWRHWPALLHMPSLPQESGPSSAQLSFGSVPLATLPQVPSCGLPSDLAQV